MTLLSSLRSNILPDDSGLIRVYTDGHLIGWTKPSLATALAAQNSIWQYDTTTGLTLILPQKDYDARTEAVDASMHRLSIDGFIPDMPDYGALGGIDWLKVVPINNFENDLFSIKRFYSRFLGLQIFAVILHGFSGNDYWVSIRSPHVHDHPGMADVLSAGTITHEQTPHSCLLDEAWHEAGINAEALQGIVHADHFYQRILDGNGFLHNEYLYIYELDTGKTIRPSIQAPLEVDTIQLMSLVEVAQLFERGDFFRPPICPYVADFLLRRGCIAETHPEYDAFSRLLHSLKKNDLHDVA